MFLIVCNSTLCTQPVFTTMNCEIVFMVISCL